MKSTIGSLFGTNRVSSSTVRHARRTKRRTSVETLESRVLLAADSVVGGFTANLESGLGEIGKELQQFVRQDPTFDRLVPGVLERQGVGADAVDGSPTVEQILDVSVDVDTTSEKGAGGLAGQGFYGGTGTRADRANYILSALPNDPLFSFYPEDGRDERALEAMDFLLADGTPGQDGNVSWQEAFDVLVAGQITRYLNNVNVADVNGADGINSVDLGLQFATFLNGGLTGFRLPDYLTDRLDLALTATSDTSDGDLKLRTDLALSFDRKDRIDLGYEADQLGFVIDPTLPGTTPTATTVTVDAGVHLRKLVFGFTGASDGNVIASDFVFAVPDKPSDPNDGVMISVEVDDSLSIDAPGNSQQRTFEVNVGFLGADVTDGKFLLNMNAFGSASDPSNPDALGFAPTQQGVAQASGTLFADAPPTFADLDASDIIFNLRVGNGALALPVEVTLDNAASNNDATGVAAALNAAMPAGLAAIVTASNDGGRVRFTLDPSNPAPLGFGSEVVGGNTITAANVSSLLNAPPPGAPIQFLIGIGGALPRVVTVTVSGDPAGPDGLTGDGDDPEDADNGRVSLASLKTSLQNALNAAFGGGTLTVSDNGASRLRITGAAPLEITHTLTLDTVDEITVAELGSGQLFSATPTSNARYFVDLSVVTEAGLERPGGATPFTPTGTILLDMNPFDAGRITGVNVDVNPSNNQPVVRATYALTDNNGGSPGEALANAASGSDMQPLLNFNVVNPAAILGQISEIGNWVDRLSASDMLSKFDIPFAGSALGNLLDFKDLISDTLLVDDLDDGVKAGTNDLERLLRWAQINGQDALVAVFGTAQELEDRLATFFGTPLASGGLGLYPDKNAALAGIDATYDDAPGSLKLTYNLNLEHVLPAVQVPIDFDMPISSLGNIEASGLVKLEAKGKFNFALGVKLGNAAAALDISPTGTNLSELNSGEGVAVNDHLALTTLGLIKPIVGRLTADAQFTVTVVKTGVTDPLVYPVTVTRAVSANNLTLGDPAGALNNPTTLVGDVNAALIAAGAQAGGNGIVATHDGQRLILKVVNDANVTRFQVSSSSGNVAFTELGLEPKAGSTVSLVGSQPVSDVSPGAPVNFTLAVRRGGSTTSTAINVTAAATDNNLIVNDLVADINAALVAAGINDVVASQSFGFLVFSGVGASVDAISLTPTSNATATRAGLSLEAAREQLRNFGVPAATANAITSLVGGVTIRGSAAPKDPFGRVASTVAFTINGTALSIAPADTAANASLNDLVKTLNARIDAAAPLRGRVVAEHDGSRVRLRSIDPTTTDLTVAGLGETEAAQIGLSDGSADGGLALTANRAAPSSFGVSTDAHFTVNVAGGSRAGSYPVTLSAAGTVNNRTIYDLAASMNNALNTAFGGSTNNPLVATIQAGQLVIGLKIGNGLGTALFDISTPVQNGLAPVAQGITGFTITPTDAPARDQLLLGPSLAAARAADHADFIVFTRDGSRYPVTLDSLLDADPANAPKLAQKLKDLADLIYAQTANKVTLQLGDDRSSLKLVDSTAGSADFRVQVTNGSPAAVHLGLFGSDTSQLDLGAYDPAVDGKPDGVIKGARIATLDLQDRFVISKPASGEILGADLTLSTVDQDASASTPDAFAEASFGFAGVKIETTSQNQQLFQAHAGIPFIPADVTLSQLFGAIGTITDLRTIVGLPTLTTASNFQLKVSVFPDLSSLITIPSNATLRFNLNSLGSIVDGLVDGPDADPTPDLQGVKLNLPDVSVTGLNIGDLANFQAVKFDNVLQALKQISAFLSQFAAFDFLDADIPLLGVSVNDLLEVAERFAKAVEDIEKNPAGGIQLLRQKVSEAFGIPSFANTAARDAFFANLGIPNPTDLIAFALKDFNGGVAGNDFLRFDLRLPVGFSEGRNVDLDLGAALGADLGPIDIQGGAGLNVKGFLDARLSFGIDLNDPAKIYLFDDATGVFGGLSAGADNLQFNAAIGPIGAFVRDGNIHFDVDFDLDNGSFNAASDSRVLISDIGTLFAGFDPSLTGTAVATLPVFFPTASEYLGDIKLDISGANALTLSGSNGLQVPDLSTVLTLPDFSGIDLSSIDPFGSIPLMLDSLDFFLQGLQDVMDGEVFGFELPLIGDQLGGAAGFIEDLRQDVLGPIRQYVEQAPQLGQELVQKLMYSLLGPGSAGVTVNVPGLGGVQPLTTFLGLGSDFAGLNLLVDYATGSASPGNISPDDIVLSATDGPDGGPEADDFMWKFRLGDTFSPSVDINFDLGWDALGFAMNTGLDVDIAWDLAFGLGISKQDGAYVFIGDHRQAGSPGNDELQLTLDVSLPDTAGADIEGRLAFLQLLIDESSVNDPDLEQDDTHFHASFGVDLVNKSNPTDEKLSFSELGSVGANVSLSADAEVNLEIVAQFNEAIVPDTVGAFLPKVSTRFILDWETGNILSSSFDLGASLKTVAFKDVAIDMGSFFADTIGPVVEKIQEVTEPLQPIIDVITTPIPVISDLAGQPVTLVDIAGLTGYVEPAMIYAIADIIELINKIPAASGELKLVLGDFTIVSATSPTGFKSALSSPNFNLTQDSPETGFNSATFFSGALPAGFSDTLSTITNLIGSATGSAGTKSLASGMLGGSEPSSSGFKFPIFENPSSIFGLLLGKNVDLITYDLAPFGMDFSYTQKFPIWGPLWGRITGSMGLTIDLAFGYDTEGVKQFVNGNFQNPLDLLAGLFVSDTNLGSSDVPELTLRGELFAGAEGNFGVLSVGVEGGLILTVNFDLYDPDRDGKVRIDELVGNFLYEFLNGNPALAPIAIFDVTGSVAAQLRAFVEALFFKYTFNITPPITLFEFEIPFDRQPILATERGDGSLLLNIGPNAAQRLNGDTRDVGEKIFVKSVDGSDSDVLVWGMGVPESAAQRYHLGAKKLIAGFGGEGNDEIDLSGVTAAGITFEIEGGAGDDTIRAAQGGGVARGDDGNDALYGGGGTDQIFGGEGGDTIEGGGGRDYIFGDSGSLNFDGAVPVRVRSLVGEKDGTDTIKGDGGDDIIFGGGNVDTIEGNDGADLILGDGGNFDFVSGAVPTLNGRVDVAAINARGLGARDVIFGNAGDDTILGGAGDDLIDGGANTDLVHGGLGFDTIYGGSGGDFLYGNENDDFIFGLRDPQGTTFGFAGETADAAADGQDYVEGGEGNDFIRGQGDVDTVHGNRGGDIIFGDAGNDVLFGQDDADIIFGGAADDTIDAGEGADIVFGDEGLVVYLGFHNPAVTAFTLTGSRIRTDATGSHKLIGDGPESLIGGYEASDDNVQQSMDLIVTAPVGTDGSDNVIGGDGKDVVFGGGGTLDVIYGDFNPAAPPAGPRPSGQDVLVGDGGRVELFGRRNRAAVAVSNALDGRDEISGNDGGDYVFGGGHEDTIWGFQNPAGSSNTPLEGVSDNDVILGDNGQISFNPNETKNRITRIFTTAVAGDSGRSDAVNGNFGDDVVLGGLNTSAANGDVLNGSVGNDIVLGDQGEVVFDGDPAADLDTLDLVRSYRDNLGGGDVVAGNAGNDVLVGGTGGDTMYGDDATASAGNADGEDVMLGDNADVVLEGPTGRLLVQVAAMPAPTAVDLITTTDTAESTGGADTMSGNAKADVMLGGVNNGGTDTLYGDRSAPGATSIANDGDDIQLGDNGLLDFTFNADADRNTLDLIRSLEDGLGGTDVLSGNKGADVGIGGTGNDTIYGDDAGATAAASDGADTLLGDNADLFLVAAGGATGGDLKTVLTAAVATIRTTDEEHPEYGGSDTISGNAKGDVIAGGVQGDTLYGDRQTPNATTTANEGDDVMLGDNGALEWLSTGRLAEIQGIDVAANNPALAAKYGGAAADTSLTTLDLITTEQPTRGGRDLIYGDGGKDFIAGGTDADTIYGDDGDEAGAAGNSDVMFGDHGRIYPQFSSLVGFNSRNFFAIDTQNTAGGEGDRMRGEEGADVMLGQQGDDRMWGGSGDDDMIGGHNVSGGYDELTAPAINATLNPPANDLMDGGSGDDAMAGDNAIVWRRGDDVSPRFRQLTAATIYTTTDSTITTNVGAAGQSDPDDAVGRDIQLVDHSDAVQANPLGRFGQDVMAGGADSDVMFGQLGDDLMQGDGNIGANDNNANTITRQITVADSGSNPDTDETLYFNVPEAATDGDDYMEGNGGNDLMYGGLGQDDMIGGGSALFGLTDLDPVLANALRPDGSDTIFGGAGIDTARNHIGDATVNGDNKVIHDATGHARDADYIMGDNANVYRLVKAPDDFHVFNYDLSSPSENRGTIRIVPRAMQQLDYTLGGADFAGGAYTAGGAANADNGAADLIHGESGDDHVFGMTGSDVIFGEGQDDDIVGGYGHDWISGGTGQDGVLGDDGLIFTSRNSLLGEPLYGIAGLLASDPSTKDTNGNVLNEAISTPGSIQTATINVAGELKKVVDLVPFSFDAEWNAIDDEFPDNADAAPYADDVIFGGLGSDFLHGGSGDDAISGAEALEHAHVPVYDAGGNPTGVLDLGYNAASHANPGDVLAFTPEDADGQHLNNRFRPGEFSLYDEYDALRKVLLTNLGELAKNGSGLEFLLNFNKAEGVVRPGGSTPGSQSVTYGPVNDDGADAVFGDGGNDWLVGGTGRDNVYGGWGNDLMNVDDDQSTNNTLNDVPDTAPTYEDRAYGGAGRDVLIANTGGDRLIDWVGEFNSYLTPFAPFGMATVSRTVQPFLPEFLYALSRSDGADRTRAADTGSDPARNGEPAGEMGLVLQKDFAWQTQTGAPADPQAGNIPGGKRDVLRSANFNTGTAEGFAADSGTWKVTAGQLEVAPTSLGGDAVSVYNVADPLPTYFELTASITAVKPLAGYKANAFLVFDYYGPNDFKFAGVNISTNKLEMGVRTAAGWQVLDQANAMLKADTQYNLLLAINGTTATLMVNNSNVFTRAFAPRVDADGFKYGLNAGMVGLGAANAKGRIDNVSVQVLPPKVTFTSVDDFSDGKADAFNGPATGAWQVRQAGGDWRYEATPAAATSAAISLATLPGGVTNLRTSSYLELSSKLSSAGAGGFVFDYYGPEDFKYALLSVASRQVVVGHRRAGQWITDKSAAFAATAGREYTLSLAIKGTTVSLSVDGQPVLGHSFNGVAVDGRFGLISRTAGSFFTDFAVKTDDPAFTVTAGATFAASAPAVTASVTSSLLAGPEVTTAAAGKLSDGASATDVGASQPTAFSTAPVPSAEPGDVAITGRAVAPQAGPKPAVARSWRTGRLGAARSVLARLASARPVETPRDLPDVLAHSEVHPLDVFSDRTEGR